MAQEAHDKVEARQWLKLVNTLPQNDAVYFNDTEGSHAVVVGADGTPRPVEKYTPQRPGPKKSAPAGPVLPGSAPTVPSGPVVPPTQPGTGPYRRVAPGRAAGPPPRQAGPT